MKRMKPYQYWFSAAGVFVLWGGVDLLFDWLHYSTTLNSAPFSLWILVNLLGFGVAAAICALTGWLLRRKDKKRKDENL